MLVRRDVHPHVEAVRWLVLLALAGAIALALAAKTSGAETGRLDLQPPNVLPTELLEQARPLPAPQVDPPSRPEWIFPEHLSPDRFFTMWQIIGLHQEGRSAEAIELWATMQLPRATETWKHVAIGRAYSQMDQLEDAVVEFRAALKFDDNNAVAHYFLGLVRLAQSEVAFDGYDALRPTTRTLVSYSADPPHSRSMYLHLAASHFEQALAFKDDVHLDQPLLIDLPHQYKVAQVSMPYRPTVGDLVTALGGDDYELDAHRNLGDVMLHWRMLDRAEQHFDAITERGEDASERYLKLGRLYEQEERFSDAARAYLKAAKASERIVEPIGKALADLARAFGVR